MEKRTKKMAMTVNSIVETNGKIEDLVTRQNYVSGFKPNTNDGKDAQAQAVNVIASQISQHRDEIKALKARLEVETVAMLSGADTDLEEPTPVDALRAAV